MIKYFCDLCKEEINKDEHYAYILPQRVPHVTVSSQGKILFTYDRIEDREIEVCDVCREKISQALEKITKEEN